MISLLERTLAGCACILLLPFFLLISFVIFIENPGFPIFFQKRLGKDGVPFTIYKFRTMKGADELVDGDSLTRHMQNAHRVTRLGKYLRRYGVDESLQLLNIMMGQMRFVGPRPSPEAQVNRRIYTPIIKSVLPGLTGIVHTLPRTRNKHMLKIRAIERTYEERRNFCSDLWVFGRTLRILLSGTHE